MSFIDFMKGKKPETVVEPGPSKYKGLFSPHSPNRAEYFLVYLFNYPAKVVALLDLPQEETKLVSRITTWVFQEKPTLRISIDLLWGIYDPFFRTLMAGEWKHRPPGPTIEAMLEDFQDADLLFGPGSPKEISKEYLIQKDKKDLVFASKAEFREFIGSGEFEYRGSNYR